MKSIDLIVLTYPYLSIFRRHHKGSLVFGAHTDVLVNLNMFQTITNDTRISRLGTTFSSAAESFTAPMELS